MTQPSPAPGPVRRARPDEPPPSIETPSRGRGRTVLPAAAPPADADVLPRIDGYEVRAEVGRGGMGVVYLARQTALKRTVALKMVLGGDLAGPDSLARFRAEAEAVARLHHPNIVQIYEVGEQGGRPFFSLEYMGGGSLDDALGGRPQPARSAAEVVKTLAEAVHHAHQNGVVHRDLKPGNVLLAAHAGPPTGRAKGVPSLAGRTLKITDFGLAKRLDDGGGTTQTGEALGTPSYMAPEQAWGRKDRIGPEADVYALGAILYEMLAGRPPFAGETPMDVLLQVVGRDPVPPRRLQPKVPRDLQTICLKCLRKQPRRRYASAADLAEDLRRFLGREPIRARPAGALERAYKWARRQPTLAALLGVCVVALAGGLAHHLQIRDALLRTEAAERKAEDKAAEARANEGTARANESLARASAAEAGEQRRRAEANFVRAKDAVDRMLTRAAEELADLPHMERVRAELLREALKLYERFLEERGDDPAVRREAARAYRRVGDILALLDDHGGAADGYGKSLALQEPAAEGAAWEARDERAVLGEHSAALRYRLGDLDGAEKDYLRSLELRRRLVEEAPENPDAALALASACGALAGLLQELGRADEVRSLFVEAGEICERLCRLHPNEPAYRRQFAVTLADAARAFGSAPEASPRAKEAFGRALGLLEFLHKEDPRSPVYRLDLVRTCRDNAPSLTREGDGKSAGEAGPPLQRALTLARRLRDDYPDAPKYDLELATTLVLRGVALRRGNEPAAAKKAFDEALGIAENLTRRFDDLPRYREQLARSLVGLGASLLREPNASPAEARAYLIRGVDLFRDLGKRFANVASYRAQLGVALVPWSHCLRKSGEPARAAEAAREAVELHLDLRRDNPNVPVSDRQLRLDYLELAEAQVASKDHASAAASARLAAARVPARESDGLVPAARVLAQCAALASPDAKLARAYADGAVELLKEAVRRGFKDATRLRAFGREKAIADRDDYRQLLQQLGIKPESRKK